MNSFSAFHLVQWQWQTQKDFRRFKTLWLVFASGAIFLKCYNFTVVLYRQLDVRVMPDWSGGQACSWVGTT